MIPFHFLVEIWLTRIIAAFQLFSDFQSNPTLNLAKNEVLENETITVECSSENANPESVLTLYQSEERIGNSKADNRVSQNLLSQV